MQLFNKSPVGRLVFFLLVVKLYVHAYIDDQHNLCKDFTWCSVFFPEIRGRFSENGFSFNRFRTSKGDFYFENLLCSDF